MNVFAWPETWILLGAIVLAFVAIAGLLAWSAGLDTQRGMSDE